MSKTPSLILASSSPYRKELLKKLNLPFDCISPDIDESAQDNESAEDLVKRLSLEKAKAVALNIAENKENTLIIASDQVAVLDEQIITKPKDHSDAVKQLSNASGRDVSFLTGLCLYNSSNDHYQLDVEPFSVTFLSLSENQIECYLEKEQPYNCAGSFKSEGLGITLFSKLTGKDPNALIGLPLIRLIEMLRKENVEPLS
jgi:MAF protein